MRGFGREFGIVGVVAVLVLGFAANSVCAQTATTAPIGKPLALLAGLRPPHEAKHKEARRVAGVHAKAAHEKSAAKIASKTRHVRMAAHAQHASATKIATRHHARHEEAVTASAFADEPPPQAAPAPPPAPSSNWPVVNAAPARDSTLPADPAVAAPASTDAAANTDPDPTAAKVQTLKITAINPTALPDQAASPVAPPAATANDGTAAMPAAATQTVLAASMQGPANTAPASRTAVGSASWIAQVLAALGGAIAAGAVAWFLIGGSRPMRTYG